MILIDDGVSICAPFNDDTFGGSLDFPLDLIRDVVLQEIIFDSGKKLAVTPYDVLIKLRVDEEAACCINGKPLMVTEIRLSVRDEKQAVTITSDLLSMRSVSKASQAHGPIDIGASVPQEDTSLSQGSKSSISSKASRATTNIMILAHELSTHSQNDTGSTKSRVYETPRRTSFQQSNNRVSDLLPGDDDGPIFKPIVKIPGAVKDLVSPSRIGTVCDPSRLSSKKKLQSCGKIGTLLKDTLDDASNECLLDLETLSVVRPGQATANRVVLEPILSGPSSERRNEESTDDPISFLPTKLEVRQASKNPLNLSKNARARTKRTALIPKISSPMLQSRRRIVNNASDVMTSPDEQNESTPRQAVQIQTAKTQPKLNVSTRVKLSLEGPQTAETNPDLAKTRALKKVKKYSLNYKPAVPILPSKAKPVCKSKTSNAISTVTWDVPTDSAEAENKKEKEVAKVETVSEMKTGMGIRRRIDTVTNKKAGMRRKNGTTTKHSVPAAVPKPGPALRSKRKAAQAANSKLQKASNDGGDAPRCNNREFSPKKKMAEGVRKPRIKRTVKRTPEQQVEANKSKIGTENNETPRMLWGATERDVGVSPALHLFPPENLGVISPPPNVEGQFQLQNRNDIALNLVDDNSAHLGDEAVSVSLDLPEVNGKDSGGALRLAQRLSSLLEGIENAGQLGAIDRQSNLIKKQTHSPIGSEIGPESSILLDLTESPDLCANEEDINEIFTPLKDEGGERSPVATENRGIVKNQSRKDLKPHLKVVDATRLISYEARPAVSHTSKSVDCGLPQKTRTPPQRSPRPLERARRTTIVSEILPTGKDNSNAMLVDEYLARKTPLVGFSVTGARNQGVSSTKKAPIMRVRVSPPSGLVKESEELQQKKRERTDCGIANKDEEEQQRFKIQKIRQAFPSNTKALGSGNSAQDCLQVVDSLPARIPVLGSQSSRVDRNGSPQALNSSTNIDRYLKLREISRKLVAGSPQKGTDSLNNLATGTDFVCDHLAFSEGEPVFVSTNSKPCPSSPLGEGEGIIRYVPHRKTASGDYVRVATKVIVPTKQTTTDPFLKNNTGRKLSEFTLRLQAERSRQISNVPHSANNAKGSEHEDPEKTLVEELSSPGDISSEISDGSQNSRQLSGRTNIGINDRARIEWAKALKPHYKDVRETLIRIVDVCSTPLRHIDLYLSCFIAGYRTRSH
jgi:hypothetical protein